MLTNNNNLNFNFNFNRAKALKAQNTEDIATPVEKITGNGISWAKEVNGNVFVKPVEGRTTLHVDGSNALKINGTLTIG